ncbi:hypothetical protein DPMN_158920 [Dreissena polymorpha]|uniref:Uncharacterized protein n=1 Tax=Dreissena polymorpha TaxID=45954 RepID=A0A9D4EN97_DREPO|nr:hypothetical protein DPMN_158920 [Dreissena polymorpha]
METYTSAFIRKVESAVQEQLFVFEMYSKCCPKEVREIANKDLRTKTLVWADVREEKNVGHGKTDTFVCQLYEILATGSTHHTINDKPR